MKKHQFLYDSGDQEDTQQQTIKTTKNNAVRARLACDLV